MFGNYLASCSYDKKVIIWKETANNKWIPFYEYAGHESSGPVQRLVVIEDVEPRLIFDIFSSQ